MTRLDLNDTPENSRELIFIDPVYHESDGYLRFETAVRILDPSRVVIYLRPDWRSLCLCVTVRGISTWKPKNYSTDPQN